MLWLQLQWLQSAGHMYSIYLSISLSLSIYLYTYIYIYMFVCMYIYVCVYIYIYIYNDVSIFHVFRTRLQRLAARKLGWLVVAALTLYTRNVMRISIISISRRLLLLLLVVVII